MACLLKRAGVFGGGIFTEWAKYSATRVQESSGRAISIEPGQRVYAFIGEPVRRGLVDFAGLYNGKVSIKMFFEAKRMADWLNYIEAASYHKEG